nr:hypothetical protein [uncultured Sulfurimonas sp.]
MNEMYDIGVVTHSYSVIGIFGVIFINIFMLLKANDIKKYARFMTLFIPISMMVITSIIFTGIVMMAAKHLDFTIENIVMIVVSIALIILENIKSKKLQRADKTDEAALTLYKVEANKIFLIEILTLLPISIWMWL